MFPLVRTRYFHMVGGGGIKNDVTIVEYIVLIFKKFPASCHLITLGKFHQFGGHMEGI